MKLSSHVLFRKDLSLILWKPRGVLDQSTVNEIVAFIEAVEKRNSKPFNRFNDLSALDAVDLNFDFVFHVALGRRVSAAPKPAVKSTFYVTSPATTALCETPCRADRLFAARRRLVHGSRCCCEVARRFSRGIVRIGAERIEEIAENACTALEPFFTKKWPQSEIELVK